jgi:hypothetical protein
LLVSILAPFLAREGHQHVDRDEDALLTGIGQKLHKGILDPLLCLIHDLHECLPF